MSEETADTIPAKYTPNRAQRRAFLKEQGGRPIRGQRHAFRKVRQIMRERRAQT